MESTDNFVKIFACLVVLNNSYENILPVTIPEYFFSGIPFFIFAVHCYFKKDQTMFFFCT
jgi:hypothetical protein